jgi:hypothetical protein
MKTAQLFTFLLVLAAGPARATAAEEPFRTDINPALRYYQAFLLGRDFSPAEKDYLLNTNDWRGQKLPERFGELTAGYDKQLGLVRQAAHATVPCDWGIDLSPGPATLLPHLARCKGLAQGARLRVMWDLQHGRQDEARDNLIGAFALGRNSSGDGTVIAALVQFAIENIICSTVAENFYRFSPENLKELVDGFETAPARGTMAASMSTEKAGFHDWFVSKVMEFQKANPGNDAAAMAKVRQMFIDLVGPPEGQTNRTPASMWDEIARAAGNSSEGVLRLVKDEEALFPRLATIMALPPGEYAEQARQFETEIARSTNPFLSLSFPALSKARQREFSIQVTQAMLRAAVEYKLHGEAGLRSVADPCGRGPFEFQRFAYQRVDRGFELKSANEGMGFRQAMIFVEKDGPAFHVTGAKVGQAVKRGES